MTDLVEATFSFKDLYSPEQSQNQRWIEIAEVFDQLLDKFVYPELERNKNIKSFFLLSTFMDISESFFWICF